ncbi:MULTISPECIES: GltB/FmdC/FwdC-like GXGXG domain-containing protein [Caproicibacterium]|uniref:Glutamate synthase n=1 Tax=Caproicibacterium argilliputei TaxID=3030016 RepID=A0AA97D9Z8_9FIRM|nr:glutamate synthase [Caproicibacterium argilliputei]WOC31551.1 glutamate synthase [Caproicibacterium argilliputei]
MKLTAGEQHFQELNAQIRDTADTEIEIDSCIGQRYIGAGLSGKHLVIHGTPGNALGAYLDGCDIEVYGNAQDATGDTMNEGTITVYGSSGDATGYAMRGGKIFVKGNIGYRAGIHMKAYKEKQPKLVVGGCAGSFLGEYQAGGIIVMLGLHKETDRPLVGNFCGTGMHGGKMFLRTTQLPADLPEQVKAEKASEADLEEIRPLLQEFCEKFGENLEEVLSAPFFVLTPDTANPYKALYTRN